MNQSRQPVPSAPKLMLAIGVLGLSTWLPQATGAVQEGTPVIETAPQGVDGYKTIVAPFFKKHCVRCHGPEKSKGGIMLHSLNGDMSLGMELDQWESVLDMLELGEMPPADEPQPQAAEVKAVMEWINSGMRDWVDNADTERQEPNTRRLTNVEYQNTLTDLLGFELDVIEDLPKDPVKPYEFNNTAEFMRMGPEQIDRYLEIARRAMASAIVDPGDPVVHKTRQQWPKHGLDRGMALDEVGVFGNRRHSVAWGMGLKSFPQTGDFKIRFQASAILPPGYNQVPLRLIMGNDININSATRQVREVGVVNLSNSPDEPKVFEFTGRIENFPALPGKVVNGKKQPDKMTITPQNIYDDGSLNDRHSYGNLRNIALPRVAIDWIEFESPIADVWPPSHHSAILFDSPLRQSDPQAYIRAVLSKFMTRAYRRPVSEDEIELFVRIYDMVKPDLKTMEAATRETLAMVLISPQFLFHTESDAATDAHYAMATRLSFFLWASMPDDELLQLAATKKLDDPAVIEQQVLRLLANDRSMRFVENFTMQWLSLQKMKTVPINRELFPRFLYYVPVGERAGTEVPYLPTIRDYMLRETVSFVGELIKRNENVLSIVDSDFAMLNQRLASHYGIEAVEGVNLRPVPIHRQQNLGGLFTQGAVLIGNGTGTAPHPIYRAVWLREAILGDEVAEPPAEVPALSDSAGESAEKAVTIAELLAKHRTVESCNDCHFRLDPWGIPFEQYNAVGRFQPKVPKEGTRVSAFHSEQHTDMAGYQKYLDSINTMEIPADSRVPHGPDVDGLKELKDYLLRNRQDEIVENVARRLLTYSVGRELNYRDRFAIEQLIEKARDKGLGMRDLIVLICQSDLFTSSHTKGN